MNNGQGLDGNEERACWLFRNNINSLAAARLCLTLRTLVQCASTAILWGEAVIH